MKLKNTALVYNVTVNGRSNCDWGTEIGQSKKHTFTTEGFPDIVNAMVYYKIDDIENIKVILGKGNRTPKKFSEYEGTQLVLASCFDKIYLNNACLEGQKLLMYILKDISELNSNGEPNVHFNRCTLKFSNSLLYNEEPVNQKCIDAITNAFGLSENGSWAILEMVICNEDELHLFGFPIDNVHVDYASKEERNSDFEKRMLDYAKAKRREAFKNYLFAPNTFKTEGAARNYWKHINEPFYKERLSFVWDKLSILIGFKSDDLFEIDNYEDAEKLYNDVLPLQANKDYQAQLASAILNKYVNFLENNQLIKSPLSNEKKKDIPSSLPLQQIFYGAPGTGKSCGIKKIIKEHNIDEKTQVIRTTFHPDSDYSTFVGAYKPTMEELPRYNPQTGDKIGVEEKIVYSFAPQAFLEAYVAAWKNQDKPVFLVIEELNRGNCAQIFGDIFQLLDRKDNGESEYPIKADQDIRKFLAKEFADVEGLEDDIQSGKVLVLPANLYIWATMNTSDQSLFPIDSAFKRRWDWEYVPIKYANGNWVIEIGDLRYSWVSFQKIVNKKVYEINHSEDKMLGDFFVKANDQDVISEKVLINKILFYLWNDVCKDGEGDIFKKDEKTDITFSDLYGSNGTTNLIAMMEYLRVEKIEDDDMDENDETNSDTQGGTGKHPKYSINGSEEIYSTPDSVIKIISDYAQAHPDMSVQDMIATWNRITGRNNLLIDSWVKSPNDNSRTPRRKEITWNNKSVWVARGWTEELFQTFIENVKKELDIDIVKVN